MNRKLIADDRCLNNQYINKLINEVNQLINTSAKIRPKDVSGKTIFEAFNSIETISLRKVLLGKIFQLAVSESKNSAYILSFGSKDKYDQNRMAKFLKITINLFCNLKEFEEEIQLEAVFLFGKHMPTFKKHDPGYNWFYNGLFRFINFFKQNDFRFLQAWTDGVVDHFVNSGNVFDKVNFMEFIKTSYYRQGLLPESYTAFNNSFIKYSLEVTFQDGTFYWEDDE